MSNTTHTLDARGLLCPLPLLKAKKTLDTLSSGQVLAILTTDPVALDDFKAFAAQTGYVLKGYEHLNENQEMRILIQKR